MNNKKNRKINKILLGSKYVNNYTKLLLILNTLDFYGDYYIPNKKLERMLKINDRKNIRTLLHQAEEEGLIRLVYRDRKRFFMFINQSKGKTEEEITKKPVLFDYNWLDDDEWED